MAVSYVKKGIPQILTLQYPCQYNPTKNPMKETMIATASIGTQQQLFHTKSRIKHLFQLEQ